MSNAYNGPYLFRVISNQHGYYGRGTILNPYDVEKYNESYGSSGTRFLYKEDVEMVFDPRSYDDHFGASSFMGGLWEVLLGLPQDKPIESKILRTMLISFFGNGAKKKLATLLTPADIINWIQLNQAEVNELMGIKPLQSRAASTTAPVLAPTRRT